MKLLDTTFNNLAPEERNYKTEKEITEMER